MAEIWDVYDKHKHKLGKTHSRGSAFLEGEYHLGTEAWIIQEDGQVLVAKRDDSKSHGGLWECPGGATLAGETGKESIVREVFEETGIDISQCSLELLGTSERQHELVETYVAVLKTNGHIINWQEGEVMDGKFVDFDTLESMMARHEFVQSVIQRFTMYKDAIREKIKIT